MGCKAKKVNILREEVNSKEIINLQGYRYEFLQ